ncbi:MAG: MFS transporter, partial [bacterium]|nr:MFS transporter [bacterium]
MPTTSGRSAVPFSEAEDQLETQQPTTSMRSFVTVWFGQLVSITGTTLTAFGLQFFIYTETGSVTRVALIALSYALPAVLAAPIAGSVV